MIKKNLLKIGEFIPSPLKEAVTYGFSTRHGGVSPTPFNSLNLGTNTDDTPLNITENRKLLAKSYNFDPEKLLTIKQVHGNKVLDLTEAAGDYSGFEADVIITKLRNIPIGILSADCLPVLLFDPVTKTIGAVHCGWRGTNACVIIETTKAMEQLYGSEPKDILAVLGPHIGPCCFKVGEVVINGFKETCKNLKNNYNIKTSDNIFGTEDGELWFDLGRANRLLLTQAGLREENIAFEFACTSCNNADYFSYRKENGITGRQIGLIMLKGES
ncbi:MAG: peptidoglycan editing factor PgeF [Deltaproteobacteria bacterium]|nr:peptidoglycan editing factor PgeF [Deltaproteobacteria bacterium]